MSLSLLYSACPKTEKLLPKGRVLGFYLTSASGRRTCEQSAKRLKDTLLFEKLVGILMKLDIAISRKLSVGYSGKVFFLPPFSVFCFGLHNII